MDETHHWVPAYAGTAKTKLTHCHGKALLAVALVQYGR